MAANVSFPLPVQLPRLQYLKAPHRGLDIQPTSAKYMADVRSYELQAPYRPLGLGRWRQIYPLGQIHARQT